MQVNISYQTLHLPPPYALAYTLKLDFRQTSLLVDFQLEYLNREELTDEEILDEGYSLDSTFEWSGELDGVWVKELKAPLLNAKLKSETEEANVWIHIEIEGGKSGLVLDPDEWEYRLQEIIQAIYEKAGYEKPLHMKFIEQSKGKNTFYELTGSFATRTCQINGKELSWDRMQLLMSDVFSMDFEGEWTEKPTKEGLWINPDGMSGYQSVAEMAPSRYKKVEKAILQILENLK